MAVDTQDKRASVLGLGLAALLVLPAPGTLDQPDRQHVAFSYRGIDTTAIAIDPEPFVITVEAQDRSVAVPLQDRSIIVPFEDRSIVHTR